MCAFLLVIVQLWGPEFCGSLRGRGDRSHRTATQSHAGAAEVAYDGSFVR